MGRSIAAPAPRTRLEQRVQLAHLSIPEFVTRFQAAALEPPPRAWCATPSLARFIDLVRLRDTVYEQLDRTHKPRQQTEE
ncbi:MAG: hypothetical protein ACRDQ4_03205 [Pseudonocardiaceae bacterium]